VRRAHLEGGVAFVEGLGECLPYEIFSLINVRFMAHHCVQVLGGARLESQADLHGVAALDDDPRVAVCRPLERRKYQLEGDGPSDAVCGGLVLPGVAVDPAR
jgi:hypothetical protein